MKTELELDKNILQTTDNIQEKLSEPPNFSQEMPITLSDENNLEISATILEDYQQSLNNLLKKYTTNHYSKNKNKHNDTN